MSLSRAGMTLCIASFCALILIIVPSPPTFASANRQAAAQDNCPLLEYGSTDATSQGAVSILQQRLLAIGQENLGQSGADHNGVDGSFGPLTQKAVKDFQSNNQLVSDGLVGPKTWAALGGCGSGTPVAISV